VDCCQFTLAAYPELRESEQLPTHKVRAVPAWPCSGWGLPGRRITANAGGLLHHLFTIAISGSLFLWPIPAGYPLQASPLRVLPGIMLYGVRTFLDIIIWRDHPTNPVLA